MNFSAGEVASYYASRMPDMRQTTSREWRTRCPVHSGTNPSFAVNSETGFAHCHSQCGRGFDMISLEQELSGIDFVRAKDRVYELVGRPKVPWEERNVTAIYEYTDETGKVLYQVLRYVGKEFKQRRPDGAGGWIWGLGSTQRVPFRLEKVIHAEALGVTEGEKDALALGRLGMAATCNNGGAGNFKPEMAKYFAGKHIAIFPDNDDPGRAHALQVAEILCPVAKSVKIVELPDLPAKGDVSDWIAAGGTMEALREIYRKSHQWTPEFEFCANVPDENDRYVRGFGDQVAASGGITGFWNLPKLSGLETPWVKLSRAMGGGLRRGEVYVIGANQGAGKTSLALQFILAAIRRAEGTVLFSMEMGWDAVFQRMASIECRVNLNDLRELQFALLRRSTPPQVRLDAQEQITPMLSVLSKMTAELVEMPLLVSTKASVTPEYIVEETRRLTKRSNIRLVVVDHMQLMGHTGSARGDYEKFTAISRAMKQTAVEIDTPVLLVSQTSRTQTKENRGELQVSDLRGSGAIEEDAAGVLLLYEDKEDRVRALSDGDGSRYTRGPVKCCLKLGKNRYGEQDRGFELMHTKTSTRFDMEGV